MTQLPDTSALFGMTGPPDRPFIVIGENIHATRVVLRSGSRVVALADGRPALPFADEAGVDRLTGADP
jgi:hypothetical protein